MESNMVEWKEEIRKRLAELKLETWREAEIIEELSQHLEDRYEEMIAGGASAEEASRAMIVELSDSHLLKQELRRIERIIRQEPVVFGSKGRTNMIADLWQDLRYAARMLSKSPGFTFVAVLTLALGIGANTAIFSVVYGVLLRPLPYTDPDRLVIFMQAYPQKGLNTWGLSQANFAMYRDQNQSFERIAAYTSTGFNLTGDGEPERLIGANVTADFFGVFGVEPALGRTFRPEEDTPGNNNVCVLSYSFWQRRFAGDPQVLGTALSLNNNPTEIVGVMPKGFAFPESGVDVWVPIGLNPQRRFGFTNISVARLKPG